VLHRKKLNFEHSRTRVCRTIIPTFFFFKYYYCAGWGYIGVFTKVLTTYQIYLNSPSPLLSFTPPTPIPGIVSALSVLHLLTPPPLPVARSPQLFLKRG
jgi:hypothetical protein